MFKRKISWLDCNKTFPFLCPIFTFSGREIYSAYPPKPKPVNAKTSSPTLNLETFSPIDETTPETSIPRTKFFFGVSNPKIRRTRKGSTLLIRVSPIWAVVAYTFMRTSLSLMIGLSISDITRPSGEPYFHRRRLSYSPPIISSITILT